MILKKEKLINVGGQVYIDIRSDQVAQNRAKKTDMVVIVGDEYITIPFRKLRFGKKITTQVFQMQYPPHETYTLLSYKWENPQKLTPLQKLLN